MGPVTKEMRFDVEFKFNTLSLPQQRNFLMHLRCNVKNGDDYYRWVQPGVAKVDFDRLPDDAIDCMFQYLWDNGLMEVERVALEGMMDILSGRFME
ncbi:hypothetical protein GX51_08095 [Blastomyces parvus]|uniref:Phage protein n=1 Tax=Blastomyces parvus TaxID=2060905 RepID=A0A2B7WGT3_9EURO|nr:hypothetical protein GX51_08095 [Blastomyces parvus]